MDGLHTLHAYRQGTYNLPSTEENLGMERNEYLLRIIAKGIFRTHLE
jgi:hypothetical protein